MSNQNNQVTNSQGKKKANISKEAAPWLTALGAAALTVSPIDIIPDFLAGAYGVGYYDDIAYAVTFVTAIIVGIVQLVKKNKKKKG